MHHTEDTTPYTPDYIYSDGYLRWDLGVGDGHPTNPRRALNTLRLIEASDLPVNVIAPRYATEAELSLVHEAEYLADTLAGRNFEWHGIQPALGSTAALMAGGTMLAVDRILSGDTIRAFNPAGAKHHAHFDHGSGFCVFNDMAMAARRFTDEGLRVMYVDWDAHHGDGVEALCADNPDVMTASIHNGMAFPGTGHRHYPKRDVWNWPLEPRATGDRLIEAVHEIVDIGYDFRPDVVLLAAGADGHRFDRMGGLGFTPEDVYLATRIVGMFADDLCGGRILAGGAGGYRWRDWTPAMWHATFRALGE